MGKSKIRLLVRQWMPPVLLDLAATLLNYRVRISGNYQNWESVTRQARGYTESEILTRAKLATDTVLKNKNMFERDGVVFEEKIYPFPLIASLLKAAQESDGKLTVLDFGGSFGSSYYQCKDFLSGIRELTWGIIEQTHFVDCGKQNFQTDVLRFYHTIEECYSDVKPNVILLSGVLQYLPEPGSVLETLVSKEPDYIIIDRTPILEHLQTRIALQVVPKSLGKASYPIRLFNSRDLTKYTDEKYTALFTFDAVDKNIYYNGALLEFKGMVFKKSK